MRRQLVSLRAFFLHFCQAIFFFLGELGDFFFAQQVIADLHGDLYRDVVLAVGVRKLQLGLGHDATLLIEFQLAAYLLVVGDAACHLLARLQMRLLDDRNHVVINFLHTVRRLLDGRPICRGRLGRGQPS